MSALLKKLFWGFIGLICAFVMSFAPAWAQGRRASEANCALTPDQILGQAYSGTAGAAGETSDKGLTPEGEDIEAAGLAADTAWILENIAYARPGAEAVAILIVDDFSSDGSGDLPASHGWLVWQVFQQLYDHLPRNIAGQITLEQVNIADEAGYQSDLILPEIQSAVAELSAQGISRFVLNMSFVFIPCADESLGFNYADFIQARRNNPERSLVEHLGGSPRNVQAILKDSRIGYIDEAGLTDIGAEIPRSKALPSAPGQARIDGVPPVPPTPSAAKPEFRAQDLRILKLFSNTKLETDPLRNFLRQSRDLTIIPVASSGNFKQRKPFYPAQWPEVISVSANEGNDVRFWLHSNNGDVSVPGAWFSFDDDQYRAGTSFAAPVVSMLIAIDLTQTQPRCKVRGNAPALARGTYNNTLLMEAVGQYCGR